MSEPREAAPAPEPLPDHPSLEWLRKHAKHRLAAMRESDSAAKLADAQRDLARHHGFTSWRALKAHVDGLSLDGRLFDAARRGDAPALAALLDEYPEKLDARRAPYDQSLLHVAAQEGRLEVVDLLLRRGFDVDARERGDNTCAMHWAAAAGHVEVVRRLIESGGDVLGRGDDHQLDVIGWATCWQGTDDDRHRAVVDLLLRHGARHHVFSAIAMDLGEELRRIVAADPAQLHRRMSGNENHQLPLHFAVRMNRPRMVELLLELGADPLGVDGSGQAAAVYATSAGIDRAVMERIRAMTTAERASAVRGRRRPNSEPANLIAALALRDWDLAALLVREQPGLLAPRGGALHLMAKRNDLEAARWLLDHGADPSARWAHWDSEVTPLHLAILGGHAEMVRLLLERGADPSTRDTKHDADALGWAEFLQLPEIVAMLKTG